MRTEVIDDVAAFAALGSQWDAALSASTLDGPYLRHAWLLAWWRAFGCGELAVITCSDDATGELLGALPLYANSRGAVSRSNSLRLFGDGRAGATGIGAFARGGAEDAVATSVCDILLGKAGWWDSLDLHPLAQGDPFTLLLAHRLSASDQTSHVRHAEGLYARPRIDLPATWDEYLAGTLSSDQRRSVRRSRKHAGTVGATVETVGRDTDLPRAIDEALALNEARLRHVVNPRYTTTPARRSFAHDLLPALLAEDRLRLSFLVIDGQRVACEVQMRYGDTRYAMWSGFLAEHARDEPSKTLFGYVAESAIAEGCRTLDFGLGNQPYKRSWGATDVQHFGCIHAYSTTASGRLSHGRDASLAFVQRSFEAAPKSLRDPLWLLAQAVRGRIQPR